MASDGDCERYTKCAGIVTLKVFVNDANCFICESPLIALSCFPTANHLASATLNSFHQYFLYFLTCYTDIIIFVSETATISTQGFTKNYCTIALFYTMRGLLCASISICWNVSLECAAHAGPSSFQECQRLVHKKMKCFTCPIPIDRPQHFVGHLVQLRLKLLKKSDCYEDVVLISFKIKLITRCSLVQHSWLLHEY